MVAPGFLHLFGGHMSASWDVCAVGYKPNGSTCTRGVIELPLVLEGGGTEAKVSRIHSTCCRFTDVS